MVPTNLNALVISNATINIDNKGLMGGTINRDLTSVQFDCWSYCDFSEHFNHTKNIRLDGAIEVVELVEAFIMEE
jgi:hypothetical protein